MMANSAPRVLVVMATLALITGLPVVNGGVSPFTSAAHAAAPQDECPPNSECRIKTERYKELLEAERKLKEGKGVKPLPPKAAPAPKVDNTPKVDLEAWLLERARRIQARQGGGTTPTTATADEGPWDSFRWTVGLTVTRPFAKDPGAYGVGIFRLDTTVGWISRSYIGFRLAAGLGLWTTNDNIVGDQATSFTFSGGADVVFEGAALGPVRIVAGFRAEHYANGVDFPTKASYFNGHLPIGLEVCLLTFGGFLFGGSVGPVWSNDLRRLGAEGVIASVFLGYDWRKCVPGSKKAH